MTIVANNSITVSNVNDGTITHTAWSYSADGTDGFTTVYPNLNLLSNSLFKYQLKDSNSAFYGLQSNVVGYEYVPSKSDTDLTISSLYVARLKLPIGMYTSSITIANNSETVANVQFILMAGTADAGVNPSVNGVSVPWETAWSNPRVTINVPPKSNKRYTLTFTAKSTNNTGGGSTPQFLIFRETTANPVTRYSKPKLEPGSTATPYMPSASDVKPTDYPSYRGEYSDFLSIASTDPPKYSWGLIRENSPYTYTAYANSTDGADGFTTVYPNLNLLNFNSGVTLGKYYGWAADITSWLGNRAYFKKVKVTPNKQYTISANWSNTAWLNIYAFTNESDTTAVARYGSTGGFGAGSWDSNFVVGYTVSNNMTFTVPANVNYIGVSYSSISTDTLTLQALLNGKAKLEPGLIATPYMPSASEVKTSDYPKYVGFSNIIKPNKTSSDYKWLPMGLVSIDSATGLLKPAVMGVDYAQARPVGSVISNSSNSSSGYTTGAWQNIGSAVIGSTTIYYWKRTA